MSTRDLSDVPATALVRELEERCTAAVIALVLKEASPEANLRIFQHCDPKHELALLALADLAHADVRHAVRQELLGPPEPRS